MLNILRLVKNNLNYSENSSSTIHLVLIRFGTAHEAFDFSLRGRRPPHRRLESSNINRAGCLQDTRKLVHKGSKKPLKCSGLDRLKGRNENPLKQTVFTFI